MLQVFLRMPAEGSAEKGQALVYATSWWTAEQVEQARLVLQLVVCDGPHSACKL